MRIAQVAPLIESVPPTGYGGTERMVSYLTEALVDLGHDVTLFASGDSVTRAELVACCPRALRASGIADPAPHYALMLDELFRRANEFDVIHFHIDCLHFPLAARLCRRRALTTLHGRLDLPELAACFRAFRRLAFVSISEAQRRPMPWLNWVKTIHHAIPEQLYTPSPAPGKYLAFLGRLSVDKRVDRAVDIAARAGMKLRIAAKIGRADRDHFERCVAPLLAKPHVEFLGEIGERQKNAFLAGARALLFPIDWPEPFGLVMIEAMACGTPVIAFRAGSVPEVIEPGVTGYVVDSVADAVRAVTATSGIDRRRCRREFERRFGIRRMAREYLASYAGLLGAADDVEVGGAGLSRAGMRTPPRSRRG